MFISCLINWTVWPLPCANTPAWCRRVQEDNPGVTASCSRVPLGAAPGEYFIEKYLTEFVAIIIVPQRWSCQGRESFHMSPILSKEFRSSRRHSWCWTCCSWLPRALSTWSGTWRLQRWLVNYFLTTSSHVPSTNSRFIFILFNEPSKTKICNFHNIVLSNQHISSCKVSVNKMRFSFVKC